MLLSVPVALDGCLKCATGNPTHMHLIDIKWGLAVMLRQSRLVWVRVFLSTGFFRKIFFSYKLTYYAVLYVLPVLY